MWTMWVEPVETRYSVSQNVIFGRLNQRFASVLKNYAKEVNVTTKIVPPSILLNNIPLQEIVPNWQDLPLRSPEELMQPERLGAFWLTRLSFSRLLIDRISRHQWQITPIKIDLDPEGRGEVIYHIQTHERELHFVVFSNQLDESERDDRVIADRWDAAAVLLQGELTDERLAQLRAGVPRQEYGRAEPDSLVWTRGNRSSRFFNHVVESLAKGRQPDIDLLAKGGYIVRSTAYYANAKFGLTAFDTIDNTHALAGSYQAQMFCAFMLREFAVDLAEHIATAKNEQAVKLDPAIRRYLGIGNATGMGLVPFVTNHPRIVHVWCLLRELALAQAKVTTVLSTDDDSNQLLDLLDHCLAYFREDSTDRKGIFVSASTLIEELTQLKALVQTFIDEGHLNGVNTDQPWHPLCDWAKESVSIEGQELLHTLLIELYPAYSEPLVQYLEVDEQTDIIPEMTTSELTTILERDYAWVLQLRLDIPEAREKFWYFSADSEEPLIGMRGIDPGEAYERPIDIPFRVQQLARDLAQAEAHETIGRFMLRHPEHRFIIQRVQFLIGYPYSEFRTNLLANDFIPLYPQRFQLAMYGMERFNPQSVNWVRVTLMQGVPTAADVANGVAGSWGFPLKPEVSS